MVQQHRLRHAGHETLRPPQGGVVPGLAPLQLRVADFAAGDDRPALRADRIEQAERPALGDRQLDPAGIDRHRLVRVSDRKPGLRSGLRRRSLEHVAMGGPGRNVILPVEQHPAQRAVGLDHQRHSLASHLRAVLPAEGERLALSESPFRQRHPAGHRGAAPRDPQRFPDRQRHRELRARRLPRRQREHHQDQDVPREFHSLRHTYLLPRTAKRQFFPMAHDCSAA